MEEKGAMLSQNRLEKKLEHNMEFGIYKWFIELRERDYELKLHHRGTPQTLHGTCEINPKTKLSQSELLEFEGEWRSGCLFRFWG